MTTGLDRSHNGIEALSEQQCRELLASQDLGRIAFSIGDQPEVFPVNYAADGTVVVFRTASDNRLQQAALRRVAFEVDGWDPDTTVGWSVVLKGVAQDVTTGIDPFSAALRERRVSPLAPGVRERWIAVYPSEISGRRFHLS
jgi:uncharacterized protein